MAADLRSRQRPALVHPLRFGLRSRVLLLSVALASAVALTPRAHAQNNGAAQGNGQGNGQAAPKDNANGAPARKTAAQRTQDDAQRLLGGPSTTLGGYDVNGTSPDTQRDALLNSERMRVARPNAQTEGGPAAAGGGGQAPAPAGGIRRAPRGGAAGGGAAANGGVAAQRAAAVNAADAGGTAATVYGSPYSERAGREVFKSPW